jgi:hypothetical protein
MVRNPGGQHADELLARGIVGVGWGEVIGHIASASSLN